MVDAGFVVVTVIVAVALDFMASDRGVVGVPKVPFRTAADGVEAHQPTDGVSAIANDAFTWIDTVPASGGVFFAPPILAAVSVGTTGGHELAEAVGVADFSCRTATVRRTDLHAFVDDALLIGSTGTIAVAIDSADAILARLSQGASRIIETFLYFSAKHLGVAVVTFLAFAHGLMAQWRAHCIATTSRRHAARILAFLVVASLIVAALGVAQTFDREALLLWIACVLRWTETNSSAVDGAALGILPTHVGLVTDTDAF